MAVEILGINQPAIGTGTSNSFSAGSIAGGTQGFAETIQQESEQNTQVKQTLVQDEKIIENLLKEQYGINVLDTGNLQVDKLSDIATGLFNYIPPGCEIYLLQNSKNKVLFNFSRPVFSINGDLLNKIKIPGLTGAEQFFAVLLSKLVQESINNTILVYKTKNKPNSLEEIENDSNLYKNLDIRKNQLNFYDFLDIDTDYYFYFNSNEKGIENLANALKIKNDINLKKFAKIPTNYVIKIRVIKDGESYFLEKQSIDLNYKDNENTKKFFGSIFVEPKYNFVDSTIKEFATKNAVAPFKQGETSFDSSNPSNYPYIKFRFKSKKSNRKFDVNLKYTVSSQIQTLSEKQVGQVRGGKYTKLDSFVVIKPTLKILDSKYSDFYSSPKSRLSAKEFITEIEKITKEKTNNKVKVFSEIQKTDNQLTDIIFEPATQDDMKMIKSGLSVDSPIYKLINKAKPVFAQQKYLYLDASSFLNYVNNRPIFSENSKYGKIGYKFKPEDKPSFDPTIKTASELVDPIVELNDLYKMILEEYPNATIEWNPLETVFSNFKIYNITIDELKKLGDYNIATLGSDKTLGEFAVGKIKYQYSFKSQNKTYYSEVPALENFQFLINNFKQFGTDSYAINKATFGNFLSTPDSREKDLLINFISELNNYYLSDPMKKINYVNKDDILYNFISYISEDMINFVNFYPSESYLKNIYSRLLEIIDKGNDLVEDAILQL